MSATNAIVLATCLGLSGTWGYESVGTGHRSEREAEAFPPESAGDEATRKGLAWLARHQSENGSWGKTYTIAVTSFACLSFLASETDPFAGEAGSPLTKALAWLMRQQKDGVFPQQGHTWIHGQGFGTLALSEAYGRLRTCKNKPDLSVSDVRTAVQKAVKVIADNQSTSGGWWYTSGSSGRHEGSTTVCAVQALVSASNHGLTIDRRVLDLGFEYLKRCQNPDGGFDYKMGPGTISMKEGTAAGVSTLGLMRKFDFAVMLNGYTFLLDKKAASLSDGRFPYYGLFYGAVGMRLLGQGMDHLAKEIGTYTAATTKELLGWQARDGSWPVKSWMKSHKEPPAFSTAWATLTLLVPRGRLSIFNRKPPKPE